MWPVHVANRPAPHAKMSCSELYSKYNMIYCVSSRHLQCWIHGDNGAGLIITCACRGLLQPSGLVAYN